MDEFFFLENKRVCPRELQNILLLLRFKLLNKRFLFSNLFLVTPIMSKLAFVQLK